LSIFSLLLTERILFILGISRLQRLTAVALLSLSISHIYLSVQIRGYMLALCFLLSGTYLLLNAITRERFSAAARFCCYACFIAACYSLFQSLILVAALFLSCMVIYRDRLKYYLRSYWKDFVFLAFALSPSLYLVISSKSIVKRSGFLRRFLFDGSEAVPAFLYSRMLDFMGLCLPFKASEEVVLLFLLSILLLGLLYVYLCRRRKLQQFTPLQKVLPLTFLMSLLITLLLSLKALYPFGGRDRHQYFLILLLLTTLWTVLNSLETVFLQKRRGVRYILPLSLCCLIAYCTFSRLPRLHKLPLTTAPRAVAGLNPVFMERFLLVKFAYRPFVGAKIQHSHLSHAAEKFLFQNDQHTVLGTVYSPTNNFSQLTTREIRDTLEIMLHDAEGSQLKWLPASQNQAPPIRKSVKSILSALKNAQIDVQKGAEGYYELRLSQNS
jgi:hypothetical protein